MPLQTNSTGVSFIYNNLQTVELGSISGNTNAVSAIPFVTQLEPQSAMFMAARQPGGVAFRGDTNVAYTSASNANAAIVQLDNLETAAARLGYTKNGAFIVVTSSTTAVTVPLTNTATNTNSQAGDTVFAKWNKLILWNLSGLDGVASASMTVNGAGTNGVNLLLAATNSTIKLDGSSACVLASINGTTVNAANAAITITPTAGGTFACVVMGS
jgi:hypothetical protein